MEEYYFNDKRFVLSWPEYEIPVFGAKIGELRLIQNLDSENESTAPKVKLCDIQEHLERQKYLACTYRGKEDISIVRYLTELGFKFVGTYIDSRCEADNFREIKINSPYTIELARDDDYPDILAIEEKIFDYSTFQIDPLFDKKVVARRNVLRVKSYFNHNSHKSFVLRVKGKVAGFLQFIIENENFRAECVNGAIHPAYQGLFIGAKLYSDAFKSIFDMGIKNILGGYCNQNMAVSKLFYTCGFRDVSRNIHLRLHNLKS